MDKDRIEFWLVWNPHGHAPTHRHYTEDSARSEAERLARVLRSIEYVCASDVVHVRTEPEEVTF